MRVFALFVVALLAAAVVVVPAPDAPVAEAPVPLAAPAFAVCPLGEAAGRSTSVTVIGGGAGEVGASVFSAGEVVAEAPVPVPERGVARLEVSDLTGVARAPLIVALDDPARRVGAVLAGAGSAASGCDAGSLDPSVMAGGSTVEGETFLVALANPFAGSARVDLVVGSEVGTESDPALEGLVVPPRSLITVDLSSLLPGRQVMSVAANTTDGRIVAGSLHEGGGDVAALSGMAPGVDWYVPVPDYPEVTRSLVLFAPGTAEVPFQLDVYGPDGLFEAMVEDTIPARGQVVVPVAELLGEAAGTVRVVAAAPVGAVLTLSGDAVRAAVPGVEAPAASWLLPGAGALGPSRINVFNPGEFDVTVELQGGGGGTVETQVVPAGQLGRIRLPAGAGGRLLADGDVIVTWVTLTDEGMAGDAGRPLEG